MSVTLATTHKFQKAGISNEPEVDDYINGLSTPLSAGRVTLLNTFVSDLKTGLSISALDEVFDIMYLFAQETSEAAVRNLISTSFTSSPVGSPTFTADEGYTGATGKYINSTYNAYNESTNFTLNNGSIGFYNMLDVTMSCGAWDSLPNNNSIDAGANHHETYPGIYARLNSSEDAYRYDAAYTDASGMTIVTRNGSTTTDLVAYRNKASASLTSTGNSVTIAIPDLEIYMLCRNLDGTPGDVDPTQIAFFFMGEHITTSMRDVIYDAFTEYLTAIS